MAKQRKSFLLYTSFADQLSILTDEEAGQLMKAVFQYVIDGTLPETENRLVEVTFRNWRFHLDADREKWEDTCKKRSDAGKNHKGNQYTENGTNVPNSEQVSKKWNKCPENGTNVPNSEQVSRKWNKTPKNGTNNNNNNNNKDENVNEVVVVETTPTTPTTPKPSSPSKPPLGELDRRDQEILWEIYHNQEFVKNLGLKYQVSEKKAQEYIYFFQEHLITYNMCHWGNKEKLVNHLANWIQKRIDQGGSAP